jgi:flagellar protein FliO/FliZ
VDTLLVALRVALSLAAVLGLLWVLQRRLAKGSRAARADLVRVVGRQGLGQKASVVVVDVDGRRFVLGVTEQSVTVLRDAEAPAALTPDFEIALQEATDDQAIPARLGTGSILSPATWRQATAALRHGR